MQVIDCLVYSSFDNTAVRIELNWIKKGVSAFASLLNNQIHHESQIKWTLSQYQTFMG